MLGITCDKCHRRFTPTAEQIQSYLEQSEGKHYSLVLCPHCGYGNKVDNHRLEQAQRFTPGQQAAESE